MAEIFYKYYKLSPSREHYLFAKELCEKIGIYSGAGKPHTQFFSNLYDNLDSINEEKLYYHTHNGMVRVFPNWNTIFRIIDNISCELDKNIIPVDEDKHKLEYFIEGVKYTIQVDIHKIRTAVFLLRGIKEEVSI